MDGLNTLSIEALDTLETALDAKTASRAKVGATSHVAEVVGVDESGVTWVSILGGASRTPAVQSLVSYSSGDRVYGTIENGRFTIVGNYTDPSAGTSRVNTLTQSYTDLRDKVLLLDKIKADEIHVRSLLAEKADVGELTAAVGRITSLETDTADIATIRANSAKVNNLTAAELEAANAYITTLTTNQVTAQQLTAANAYISALTAGLVTAQNIVADHGTVSNLSTNYAHITDGRIDNAYIDHSRVDNLSGNYAHITEGAIDNATISHARIDGLSTNYAHIANGVIDNATIGHANVTGLAANYASISLANVDNAWIENGVIKNGTITDAKIASLSANKLTAGTIDASVISVTNLQAKNISVEKINGQTVTGKSIADALETHESDISDLDDKIDNAVSDLNDRIDAQIQTWTATDVPTLNNYPASDWTTDTLKSEHVGDICYVVNASSQADGYTYRFAYDNTTQAYSWILIKDNQVTAALQRLLDAEGDIDDLESFQTSTTSWMTTKDGEVTSLQTRATSLETRMGTAEGTLSSKVDTTTFNTLSQTVDSNTSSITSLTTRINSLSIEGRNLLEQATTDHDANEYRAYRMPLTENLVEGDKYTIQLWNVNVVHGNKSVANLGVDVYWGGGVNFEIQWHGSEHFENGHADYLVGTFTATVDPNDPDAEADSANAWLDIYNSAPYTDGDMSLSIWRCKLEKGETATAWVNAPEDVSTVISTTNRVEQTASENSSRITAVTTTTNNLTTRMTSAESSIVQNATSISTKVSLDGVISSINQSPETIAIEASRLDIAVPGSNGVFIHPPDDYYNGIQLGSSIELIRNDKSVSAWEGAQIRFGEADARHIEITDTTMRFMNDDEIDAYLTEEKFYTNSVELSDSLLFPNMQIRQRNNKLTIYRR